MTPDGYPRVEELGKQQLADIADLRGKFGTFAGTAGLVLVFDVITKAVIQQTLSISQSVAVLGDFFRLTYIHNPGAAFGLHLGPHSRVIFLTLALIALGVLAVMYRQTPATDRLRLFAIGAIAGGALGNVIDRIRSRLGVVDFLDFGIGDLRWPVFNLADTAVTVGAMLLLASLWAEDQRRDREKSGTS